MHEVCRENNLAVTCEFHFVYRGRTYKGGGEAVSKKVVVFIKRMEKLVLRFSNSRSTPY